MTLRYFIVCQRFSFVWRHNAILHLIDAKGLLLVWCARIKLVQSERIQSDISVDTLGVCCSRTVFAIIRYCDFAQCVYTINITSIFCGMTSWRYLWRLYAMYRYLTFSLCCRLFQWGSRALWAQGARTYGSNSFFVKYISFTNWLKIIKQMFEWKWLNCFIWVILTCIEWLWTKCRVLQMELKPVWRISNVT